MNEVKQFSRTLKQNNFKIWLSVHYSDTWADPGQQITPIAWQNLNLKSLKDSVYQYTKKIITEIDPDYYQIGNEINTGFLHPIGHITQNFQGFFELLKTNITAIRKYSNQCKIILHFAGLKNSDWFFNQVKHLDYDIIGLSYYPIWHGKSLDSLSNTLNFLSSQYHKNILIAETAYPFTLGWKDWTNNIVGLSNHLILPNYLATPQGQSDFTNKVKTIIKSTSYGIGFCYWGAELISWNGNHSTNGSPWENQALFDFDNKALTVLKIFK